VDAGSDVGVDNFTPDVLPAVGSAQTFTGTVDLSGVTDPAPQGVYSTYSPPALFQRATVRAPGARRHLHPPLHLFEPDTNVGVGGRVFDVKLQGTEVASDYDIVATAGAAKRRPC